MHNGDTSFWRNPWKINEPVPGGTSLSLCTSHPLSLSLSFPSIFPAVLTRSPRPWSLSLLQPQDAIARLAVVAARTLRRTRINAIMNLSRWDLTIQDVATTPPPRHPIRRDVLRHPASPPTPHLH